MTALQKAIDVSGGKLVLAEFTMGLLLSQTKRNDETEAVLRRALEHDANYSKGYVMLAAVLYDQRKFDEAEKLLQEAERRSPDIASSYLIHAKVHWLRGDTAKSMDDLQTYVRLLPPGLERQCAATLYQKLHAEFSKTSNSQRR